MPRQGTVVSRAAVRARVCLLSLLATAAALQVAATAARADGDTTAPQLVAFSFTPTTVDLTAGAATVQVNVSASDNLSGVTGFAVSFLPPGGTCGVGASKTFAPNPAPTDSVFFPLGQYSTPPGLWSVCAVTLCDASNNCVSYTTADLQALGFQTDLTVIATVDATPPRLDAFSVGPAIVDLTNQDGQITATYSASDDLSGVSSVTLGLMPPGGACSVTGSDAFSPVLERSGSIAVPLARFAPPVGQWTVCRLSVCDQAGNCQAYTTSDLTALGFMTTVTVIGVTDTTPPQLTALSIAPATVNLAEGPLQVSVAYSATDDLSGVVSFAALFAPDGESCGRSVMEQFQPATLRGGTLSFIVGRFQSSAGDWPVCTVSLCDAAGNCRNYGTADLALIGLARQLTVIDMPNPTPPQPSINVSGVYAGTYHSVEGFEGTLEATLEQSAATVSGTLTLDGSSCLTGTTVSGAVSGATFIGTATSGDGGISFRLTPGGGNLSGLYAAAPTCLRGDTGTLALIPLPGATPTASATSSATAAPSATPTPVPSDTATATPTVAPTAPPTVSPTTAATSLPTATATRRIPPTRTPVPCPGDCNADGVVSIDELILGVDIALGSSPVTACPAFDTNGDRQVSIDELIHAVAAALGGCPG